MKYLKVWEGVINNEGANFHNNGHMETKTKIINGIGDLVKTYDTNATYFKLQPVDVSSTVSAIIDLEGD